METQNDDKFERWARLMDEWNTASRLLDMALATRKPVEESQLSVWLRTIEQARKHQEEVKQRIDILIRDVMSARALPSGGLVIGRVDVGMSVAADGAAHDVQEKLS